MIPRTFPSVLEGNTRKMVVYILPSVVGLQAWKDYIPVKGISVTNTAVENTYANDGYQVVKTLGSTTGTQAWVDYIPVYEDATLTKPWSTDIGGYIPASGLSSLNLDFTLGRLDPRITFSRTSNATLTGSNGLVQYAPHNLLTYSEQFDNAAWTKTNVTVTANAAVSPDGAADAEKFVGDSGASITVPAAYQVVTKAAAATTYTYSVFAKSAGFNRILMYVRDGASSANQARATISLVDGSVVAGTVLAAGTFTAASAVSAPAGNGWYKVSLTFTTGTETSIRPSVINSDSTATTCNGTDGIFVWGAQLELGSTATTYNPTTVKNLLGFTEAFDNAAWTKSNASISATKVDDIYGQPFAQQVTSSASNGTVLSTYTAVASTPYTFSIWMKRVTGTGNIDISADGTTWETRTLTTEWQRFSVTASPTAGSKTPGVRIATSGDSIYIFGAQLSDSASVDPYVYNPVAAPTSTAYYGPRFDYDPVTLAPKGLLIEEQRTNLILNSVMAGGGSAPTSFTWTIGTGTSTPATSTASTIGVAYTQTATAQRPFFDQSFSGTAGTTYAVSFIVEATDGVLQNTQILGISGVTPSFFANGVSVSATAVAVTGRLTAVFTAATTTTYSARFGIGVGGAATGTMRFSCPQVEAGSFATSYIPTVASQVTRAADSASMIGNNFARWYNQTAGTFYAQAICAPGTGALVQHVLGASDGSLSNLEAIYRSTGKAMATAVTSGGASQHDSNTGVTQENSTTVSSALALEAANSARAFTNVATAAVTVNTMPVVNQLRIGDRYDGARTWNGTIKRIAYFPRRLSNSELQSITA